MSAILIAICLALTFICTRTTYWIFKVFVGFFWWGLAFYWVKLPASTDPSLQTILIMLPIFTGVACMFWAFWVNRSDVTNQHIGQFSFGKDTSEDERSASTRVERNNAYRDRINRRMG